MVDNTPLFRALIKLADEKAEKQQSEEKQSNGTRTRSVRKATPPRRSSPNFLLYSSHARQLLADIRELRALVLDKRKEYILCSNAFSIYGAQKFMSDEDRKKFDRETDIAIKQCTKLLRDLEMQLNTDRELRPLDEYMHLKLVLNLLSVYLKEVLAIVAQLREIHMRKMRQIRKICRLANLVDMYSLKLEDVEREEQARESRLAEMRRQMDRNVPRRGKALGKLENVDGTEEKENAVVEPKAEEKQSSSNDGWEDAELPELVDAELPELLEPMPDSSTSMGEGWADAMLDLSLESTSEATTTKIVKPPPRMARKTEPCMASVDEPSMAPVDEPSMAYEPVNKAEQAQLVAENRKMFDRFASTDSELVRIETHVAEIQRLQNMFAEKIGEQVEDIEQIHARTVYTLDNLEQANNFIREAIKNQANRRVIMIFCLLVLTFTLLFLDWYNP